MCFTCFVNRNSYSYLYIKFRWNMVNWLNRTLDTDIRSKGPLNLGDRIQGYRFDEFRVLLWYRRTFMWNPVRATQKCLRWNAPSQWHGNFRSNFWINSCQSAPFINQVKSESRLLAVSFRWNSHFTLALQNFGLHVSKGAIYVWF